MEWQSLNVNFCIEKLNLKHRLKGGKNKKSEDFSQAES